MKRFKYVILGGGMVAGYAARELAQQGLKPGELAIFSAESTLPYERPPLSKGFLLSDRVQPRNLLINKEVFYHDSGIEVFLEQPVTHLDLNRRSLETEAGASFGFEKLLIATGSKVRRFETAGSDLDGIYYLRSVEDAEKIRSCLGTARQAVVIGGGFIGMEVSSVLAQRKIETVLVFPEERVWKAFFTPEISHFFESYFEARGVRILRRRRIDHFEGRAGVEKVVLDDGTSLPASLVIGGIGVTPVTGLFEGTGLAIDNGLVVDESLESAVEDVFAAGDVACYFDRLFQRRRRIEHWDNAVEQGRYVAHRFAGGHDPFTHVPYFFSDVFDLSYDFWGDPTEADQTLYRGDVEQGRFSAWWMKNKQVIAAFIMGRPDSEREEAPELIRKTLERESKSS